MNQGTLMGVALILAAALFGYVLGAFVRFGSTRVPLACAAVGVAAMAALLALGVIAVDDDHGAGVVIAATPTE